MHKDVCRLAKISFCETMIDDHFVERGDDAADEDEAIVMMIMLEHQSHIAYFSDSIMVRAYISSAGFRGFDPGLPYIRY